MDTSIRVARSMMRGWKGRGPRGVIGDTDSRSTSGPDPAAGDIRIITEELQCLREYRHEDQQHIEQLQQQLVAEQELGHAEGMVRAAQLQHGSAMSCNYSRGCPLARTNDDEYAHDLHRAMEDSRRTSGRKTEANPP